jgi:hypothetical protein
MLLAEVRPEIESALALSCRFIMTAVINQAFVAAWAIVPRSTGEPRLDFRLFRRMFAYLTKSCLGK